MKQTYTIPAGFPPCILSLVISNTSKYGRPVLITEKGVVYQNGCVQTIILKDIDEKGMDKHEINTRVLVPYYSCSLDFSKVEINIHAPFDLLNQIKVDSPFVSVQNIQVTVHKNAGRKYLYKSDCALFQNDPCKMPV